MDEGYGDDKQTTDAEPANISFPSRNNDPSLNDQNSPTFNENTTTHDDMTSPKILHKTTPFRFKSDKKRASPDAFDKDLRPHKSSHKYHKRSRDDSPHRRRSRHDHESSHKHCHRRHKERPSSKDEQSKEQAHPDPRMTDANYNQDPPELDADAAFRESLFDALADDEGADYWANIYGQPIHTYSRAKVSANGGTLEEMTEDEYVAYVRRKMWERSHEGMEEARKERAREAAEEQKRKDQEDSRRRTRGQRSAFNSTSDAEAKKYPKNGHFGYLFDFDELMDGALKRGAERKQDRRRKDVWIRYLNAWDELLAHNKPADSNNNNHKESSITDNTPQPKPKIPWPTPTGSPTDISKPTLQTFFETASMIPIPRSSNSKTNTKSTTTKAAAANAKDNEEQARTEPLLAILKRERVRWHPDKMQHRLGGSLDDETLKQITSVFQIVDSLWDEARKA